RLPTTTDSTSRLSGSRATKSHWSPASRSPSPSGSQRFSFLATKLHFSSSCSLVVEGGKAHQLVVGRLGVLAGQPPQARGGAAVAADEPFGVADAAPLLEVGQDGARLVVVEPAGEERRALALGEAPLAGLAVQQAAVVAAVAGADGDVALAALAVA